MTWSLSIVYWSPAIYVQFKLFVDIPTYLWKFRHDSLQAQYIVTLDVGSFQCCCNHIAWGGST